ncbi:MAG: SOS response-associated peptidase family protein [Bulleidia sp.]|nr:SOS response-associated peptidase family protein [Bulleidia sp.]
MCGRYLFFDEKNEALRDLIDAAREKMQKEDFEQISLFEVFPGQRAFAIASAKEKMKLVPMLWGYQGKSLVINARSETAFSSPFFAGSGRCVIPCSGYYEWSKQKRKYYFSVDGTAYLGALYRREADGYHFVILTEDACKPMNTIHPRMPVLFTKQDAVKWCRNSNEKEMLCASLRKRNMTQV